MKKRSQPLRLEAPHHVQLVTSKTINGALWFANIYGPVPDSNRRDFERDFNARIAESVRFLVKNFGAGPVFQRRYTPQAIVGPGADLKYFNYIAHQCISSKLASSHKYYPAQTLTDDAVKQVTKTYRYFKYSEFIVFAKKIEARNKNNPVIQSEAMDLLERYAYASGRSFTSFRMT